MPTRLSAVAPATAPALTPAQLTPARLARIADSFAARPELWRPQVRFVAEERWHARLAQTPEHEVWLLTWLPGQGTEVHDHGGASGAFSVVEGVLTERSFRRQPPVARARELREGGTRSFGPRYIHEVANRGTAPAVSVHAYSPVLAAMSYYRETADGRIALDRTDPVED
ncbi:cysteine dioxygenase [Streptomyces sp. NPDC048172]|uniref:cysteine dioxygenase n=1 Tax=Streptomyces sp. NPDC048172 TaxID=3365505 RepID=UPI00371828EE